MRFAASLPGGVDLWSSHDASDSNRSGNEPFVGRRNSSRFSCKSKTKRLNETNKRCAQILILPNHGALACGSSVEEAWHMAFHCILACESQLRAIPMGLNNLNLSSVDSSQQVNRFFAPVDPHRRLSGHQYGERRCWGRQYVGSEMGGGRTGMVNVDDRFRSCSRFCLSSVNRFEGLSRVLGLSYRLYLS